MELGTIIAIVVGIIVVGVVGVVGGIFIVINYMASPNGFVKDLTDPQLRDLNGRPFNDGFRYKTDDVTDVEVKDVK